MDGSFFRYCTPNGLPPNGCAVPGQAHPPFNPFLSFGYATGSAYGPYNPLPPPWYAMAPPPPPPPRPIYHGPWPGYQPGPPPPPPPYVPPFMQPLVPAPTPANNVRVPPSSNLDGLTIGMPNGTGYLFPTKSTVLHLIAYGYRPWENPNQAFQHQVLQVPDSTKVNELIQYLEKKFSTGKLRAIEFHQRGNGEWQRRSAFVRDGDNTGKRLEEVGWGGAGKGGILPLWIGVELA
jgi:hypothetical protein